MAAKKKSSQRATHRKRPVVAIPDAIWISLTKAQLKELKPLFKAVNEYADMLGPRAALYAQPHEGGSMPVGILLPGEAQEIVEFMRKVFAKRRGAK